MELTEMHIFIIFGILFLALFYTAIKQEPQQESFKNMLNNTRATINKHKRNIRHSFTNAKDTIHAHIKRGIRLSGL